MLTPLGQSAAHVEADAVEYLLHGHARLAQLARSAHNGPQLRARTLAQGYGVAHVVGVVVGYQYNVRVIRSGWSNAC